jgi:ubiquinone/menaquinone biosynthesis C-methylase UbiE
MRALTHISIPAAPDYTLRVPSHLQILASGGVIGGLGGLVALVAAPAVPARLSYLLLAAGGASAAFALALAVITSPRLRARARQRMIDSIAWQGDERVLDVGCGNGFLLNEVAKHLRSGSATGIDLWKTEAGEQTAQTARRNARLEGVADRVDIKNADARSMPFADGTFNVIVSSLMLHHAGGRSDRERVLNEMVRVLKPGGAILLYDVAPLIAGAAKHLYARGFQFERFGRVMVVLSVRRPVVRNLNVLDR